MSQIDNRIIRLAVNKEIFVFSPPTVRPPKYSVRPAMNIGRAVAVFAQHLYIMLWTTVSYNIWKSSGRKKLGPNSLVPEDFHIIMMVTFPGMFPSSD